MCLHNLFDCSKSYRFQKTPCSPCGNFLFRTKPIFALNTLVNKHQCHLHIRWKTHFIQNHRPILSMFPCGGTLTKHTGMHASENRNKINKTYNNNNIIDNFLTFKQKHKEKGKVQIKTMTDKTVSTQSQQPRETSSSVK